MHIGISKRTGLAGTVLLLALIPCLIGEDSLQVGYTILRTDAGVTTPVGTALFTYTNSQGVLVSQAGVESSSTTQIGRVYVDQTGAETGIALVNATMLPATVALILRNAAGREVARTTRALGAGEHLAQYVSQIFGNAAVNLRGSLTFESDQPLAAITLREVRNIHGEPLYTTLPVINLAALPTAAVTRFPHIAAGGGYTTQFVLINPRNETATGKFSIFASDGSPLRLSSPANIRDSRASSRLLPESRRSARCCARHSPRSSRAWASPAS